MKYPKWQEVVFKDLKALEENDNWDLNTLSKRKKGYRRLVGRHIYLTITLPEKNYLVHILNQFMLEPLQVHWLGTMRVLRYLKFHWGRNYISKGE